VAPLVVVVLSTILWLAGCSSERAVRPNAVPADAIYSAGGKIGGWWQRCDYDSVRLTVRCAVWNVRGEVLVDDAYDAYDGKLVQRTELAISQENVHAGGGYIRLRNGRYLIPHSRFEQGKRFLDDFARQ